MTRHRRANMKRIKTVSIRNRQSKVTPADFASPFDPGEGTFDGFIRSLPRILAADDLRRVVEDMIAARRSTKPVILMMGAHVVKVGLSPVITDLMRRGIITAVAMNSAAAIHDVETAMWGHTSEDVAAHMMDGTFGMAKETGDFINGTLKRAARWTDDGYGEALGKQLVKRKASGRAASILAAGIDLNIPVTVHAAIGTDIVHQQPGMDGAATGEMSFRDFRSLCATCGGLLGGGVVLNIGSAVIMPEVFLKALTVARNLGADARGFTTAVFDMNNHYRPTMNVRLRPTQDGGHGYAITGHHEIMVPLLAAMVKSGLK